MVLGHGLVTMMIRGGRVRARAHGFRDRVFRMLIFGLCICRLAEVRHRAGPEPTSECRQLGDNGGKTREATTRTD